MYIVKVAEVSFSASGDEFGQLIANLLFCMHEFARARNVVDSEASVSPDRTMSINRQEKKVAIRLFFNIRKDFSYRMKDIIVNFVDDFLSCVFPKLKHLTYSFRVFDIRYT